MPKYTDVALTDTGLGYYDISIGSDGDIVKTDSFDTAILLSLFGSDRRATETEVPNAYQRRGWIGDINRPVELGSKLWLIYQARLTISTLNIAKDYISQALQWLVDFGYLKSFSVSVERDIEAGSLSAFIQLIRLDDSVESRNYVLWTNTGRG